MTKMYNISPDLELNLRRSILQPKPGTRIPGYTGHRPGLRFGFGSTYGEMTHILEAHKMDADDESERHLAAPSVMRRWQENSRQGERRRPRMFHVPDPKNDSSAVCQLLRGEGGPPAFFAAVYRAPSGLQRSGFGVVAPPSGGYKSGYTGYVPRLRDQLGVNYAASAEEAKRQFVDERARASTTATDLMSSLAAAKYGITATFPALTPVADDEHVRHHAEFFKTSRARDTRRRPMEPPIVGYQGHIPRLQPTSLPVGRGYAGAAQHGLQHFYEDQQQQRQSPTSANSLEPCPGSGSSLRTALPSARPRTCYHSRVRTPEEISPSTGPGVVALLD